MIMKQKLAFLSQLLLQNLFFIKLLHGVVVAVDFSGNPELAGEVV